MKKLKILVLDSNPIIYFGLKAIFKNSIVFEISSYSDNKDLLIESITEEKIDFIISEINLNGSTALEILKILKKNKIEIPVVIFTSISNENKSIKLLKAGASGFLTKDLKKKTIRHLLQEIAFSKYTLSELNKFTRLKNRFNFDYNTEKINSLNIPNLKNKSVLKFLDH